MTGKTTNNEKDELYYLLAEYFARYRGASPIFIFDQLVKIIEIFAEENDRFGHMPKGCTYAGYIAGLILSISEENDRQRAIKFLESPELPFDRWKEDF